MDETEKLEEQLRSDEWATYFIGRYYFAVNTYKTRLDFGLNPGDDISGSVQKKMQSDNLIALFHEYFHYIHEISTVIGNLMLGLDIYLKSIFSKYFNTDLTTCTNSGIDRKDKPSFEKFVQVYTTKETLNGTVLQGATILRVLNISQIVQRAQIPDGSGMTGFDIAIPVVKVEAFMDGAYKTTDLYLGRFFIYEGLAYELDRELERRLRGEAKIRDTALRTEYTVLRLVALFLCPDATTRQFLSLASLSLSYLNSGAMFVALLRAAKQAKEQGISIDTFLEIQRNEVRQILTKKMDDFDDAQDEMMQVFLKRTALHKAFSAICNSAKSGYRVRMAQPTFEIDLIFDGKYEQLLNLIPICDYMYVFTDADAFNRDFFGTASFPADVSRALKVLITYDHYQKSHRLWSTAETEMKGPVKCPFFSCCNLELRKTHENICREKPWRIFEISAATDQQYCWYGAGVGEFKATTEV